MQNTGTTSVNILISDILVPMEPTYILVRGGVQGVDSKQINEQENDTCDTQGSLPTLTHYIFSVREKGDLSLQTTATFFELPGPNL